MIRSKVTNMCTEMYRFPVSFQWVKILSFIVCIVEEFFTIAIREVSTT